MYLDTRQSILYRLNHQVLQATVLQLFYQAVACSRTNAMMLFMTSKVRSIVRSAQAPTDPHLPSVHGVDGSNLFYCLRGQVDSSRTVVCIRLVLFPTILAQPYVKTVLRKVNR